MTKNVGTIICLLILCSTFSFAEQIEIKGEPVALSPQGEYYMEPKWSPDGSKLSAGGSNFRGIFLISFPSGTIDTLTRAMGAGFRPSWSPGSDAMAARLTSFEGNRKMSQFVLLYLDGTSEALTEVQPSLQGVPVWSKSGEFIYLNSSNRFQSYSPTSAGSKPSSGVLPYLNTFDIYLHDLGTGQESKVFDTPERILYLEISPSETQFVYTTASENLWIADMDGSRPRKLGRGYAPSWSPDGNWIACMLTEDDGHVITQSEILIYNADTGASRLLSSTPDIHEMHPAWSPDGNWIAYGNEIDGRIWVVEIEGR
jgi:Tol biopolymer transport system component